jgi:hypothetical protein
MFLDLVAYGSDLSPEMGIYSRTLREKDLDDQFFLDLFHEISFRAVMSISC